MHELTFDVEDAPTSLPFVVVLFVSFIAFNIERSSLVLKLVLDSFGGRLDYNFAILRGCYPTIYFHTRP